MNSLKGKKCLITGASSGLGLELTKLFIQAEAEVIMLCRDKNKSDAIINDLLKDYPNAKIQLELADFSSLRSLKDFIKSFKSRYSSLDILINNAGLLKARITKTHDGFESMFQVNYLAAFVLTNSLIDLLKSGNDPHFINIALPSEKLRVDFEDIQSLRKFKPMNSLMKSKLCLFLYSVELAERIKNSGIKVITGIPNDRPFKSNIGREMPFLMGLVWNLITVKTEDIAVNIPNVLLQDNLETGYIFKGLKDISSTQYWQNNEIRNRLWQETECLLQN